MSEVTTNYENQPAKRPTFLTVLCILTFIGSGLGLLGSIPSLFMGNVVSNVYNNTDKIVDSLSSSGIYTEQQKAEMQKAKALVGTMDAGNLTKNAWTNLAGYLLCLLGAILMWKQRKNGFFIYVAGCILALLAVFLFPAFSGGMMGSMMKGIGGTFVALICGAFCVMYGLNLKHMK